MSPCDTDPVPTTGEQLAAVQSMLGLNKTQLAEVCAVTRHTINEWYAGDCEASGANALRLAQLCGVVTTLRRAGLPPVAPQTANWTLPCGASLLDLLRAETLNADQIHGAVAQLHVKLGARIVPEQSRRERLGWRPLSDEERQAQLDSNLDYFVDG